MIQPMKAKASFVQKSRKDAFFGGMPEQKERRRVWKKYRNILAVWYLTTGK